MAYKKNSEKSSSDNYDKKILEEAQSRFDTVVEAQSEIRRQSLDDIEFSIGDQWPDDIKAARERDGRPCLVVNKIPQFIQQVTNDQRQNRPSIVVHPVDDKADVETAKILQGLIRHIQYNSNAEVAYDNAFDGAVRGGFGYFRIITDYVSPMGFEQEILIKQIKNQFSVFFDPFSVEPDGSDAMFAMITEDISQDEYKKLYPDSRLASQGEWEATGNVAPLWMPDGSARVAEYFYKEFKKIKIVQLSDGSVIEKDQLPEILPEGIEIVNERESQVPVVKWAKINGCEILEKRDWPGKYIPIVPVYGNDISVNGVRVLEGIVRNAKDPAKMYNYWTSAETEAIALAPRAPFIAAEGQLEGYEADWESANRRNHSVLTYKATTVAGQPIAPPQRNAFEPAVQAITQARMLASDDIKATTGIYDASLGNRSNEQSGVAIQRRAMQAQTSNFHFIDNLSTSLRHAGRILIDLIPKIYDSPRIARIVSEDGEQEIVAVNQPTEYQGKEVIFALDVGQYDVTVDVGPSFQTKRQEAVANMIELSKAVPQLMQIAGDLLVKNMDWPGATDIADRLKKTLPPGIADDPKNKNPIPPQVQAQMQQMNQLVEQLTAKLNELQDEKEQKLIEIESKERIEMAKLETQATIELAKLESKEALSLLANQIAEIDQRTKMLGFNQPFEMNEQEQFEIEDEQNQLQQDQNFNGMEGNQEIPEMTMNPTGGDLPGLNMEGNLP